MVLVVVLAAVLAAMSVVVEMKVVVLAAVLATVSVVVVQAVVLVAVLPAVVKVVVLAAVSVELHNLSSSPSPEVGQDLLQRLNHTFQVPSLSVPVVHKRQAGQAPFL